MRRPQAIDEVFGTQIYFDPVREKFTAECDGREYEADRLSDIKRDLAADSPVKLDEPVIYASDGDGEMVLTNIVAISPHGSLRPGTRVGLGVSPNPAPEHIFPRTAENMKVYERHKKMRERGWALIWQADAMASELKPHPKNYWIGRAKDIRATEREE